ncbi:hypothetical protein NQ317_010906 [Molorchus minor]|uniref:Immunoglobulin V-set domain-containing protein n=1 Tax=Molorchus minor TaxID=1323400 RepID=A0ABQ9J831_9CUCU|nr:hypothetical protein NQ317_010906 [Molorchus minor]
MTAVIHEGDVCDTSRRKRLNFGVVSWIRKRDLHILTVGIYTYTSDQRFQVIRPDKSDNWTLQIKFPQLRDSGIYECQINTEPKMSLAFRLNVIGKFISKCRDSLRTK